MKQTITADPDFITLKRKIFDDTHLDCSQYKDSYLQRRLNIRMRATDSKDYREYYRLLCGSPSEYEFLLSEITINVTQFYRDRPVFQALADEIVPLLIWNKVKNGESTIRVWSAGCSSGEEPYSVAMVIHDLLGEDIDSFDVKIMATDIDDEVLTMARIGKYLPRQMVNVPKDLLQRYFTFDGEVYEVNGPIKRMVQLKNLDLISGSAGKGFDMILCRNVVIYFTRDMQERLYMKFFHSLCKGGYFVMGNTETLAGDASKLFTQVKSRERIFQKISD